MADGLRRATLEALCSRGPWASPDGWVFPGDVREVYDRIVRGGDFRSVCPPWTQAVVLNLLHTEGLVSYHNGDWSTSLTPSE